MGDFPASAFTAILVRQGPLQARKRSDAPMSQPITLDAVSKSFGGTLAVDAVTLTIPAGHLFFLLGPSGCGKTTLLRMIAGFTQPTRGSIRLGPADVTNEPPERRNCGMVFQGYALWPHMTVEQNVAFGLEVRGVPPQERAKRVSQALEAVHMTQRKDRKPHELSGGQQQRVALARALVIEPTVLLLDEPLSNLDARLRHEMRAEITRICRQAGITAVYVTHDQKEALSMADGIAIMAGGKVVQLGTPRELYQRPTSRFVADFLGESNFFPATVTEITNGHARLQSELGMLISSGFSSSFKPGDSVTCSLRPECISVLHAAQPASTSANIITARHVEQVYLGELAQHSLRVNDRVLVRAYEMHPREAMQPGHEVRLAFAPQDVVLLRG